MATYLFSENRELKNIQDGDVVVNDCAWKGSFVSEVLKFGLSDFVVHFSYETTIYGADFYTAHFTRINTEPQPAPNTPAPMGSD